jgi:hypothetical protein
LWTRTRPLEASGDRPDLKEYIEPVEPAVAARGVAGLLVKRGRREITSSGLNGCRLVFFYAPCMFSSVIASFRAC